ncbi:MAG: hypothetical protein FWC03_08145 [Treponema sp.]|nr:hypothetical protein [Treponema sp.]
MFKKMLFVWLIIIAMIFAACPTGSGTDDDDDDGTGTVLPPPPPPPPQNTIYSSQLLGEWIRMDTGERWYINGNSIEVTSENNPNPQILNNSSVTLYKTSDQVIRVKQGGNNIPQEPALPTDYFLFASRTANAGFNMRVVYIDNDNPNPSTNFSRNAGEETMRVRVTNPKQPLSQPVEVEINENGEIEVENQIPGDPLEVVPTATNWSNVKIALPSSWGNGMDMGIIPLTTGVNIKTSIRLANSNNSKSIDDLIADNSPVAYTIEVENIGTGYVTGASYFITWDEADFSLVSGQTQARLDTMTPGEKRQIQLTLRSKRLADGEGFKNKLINIRIVSYDTQTFRTKTWDDTVSIGFYNIAVPFVFRSDKEVQGVIRTPRNKTHYFKTEPGNDGNYFYTVSLPWSNDNFIITFLGASVEARTEAVYSLGINAIPSTNWDSLLGENMFINEPGNNVESTATELNLTSNTFMGYLHDNDIDYYRVNLGNTPPTHVIDDPIITGVQNGTVSLTLNFNQISDVEATFNGVTGYSELKSDNRGNSYYEYYLIGPTIYRTSSSSNPASATITLQDTSQYSSVSWQVDNISSTIINSSGNNIVPSFTLNSSNTAYNQVGSHFLTLMVVKAGIPYSRTIIFNVE